MILTLTSSEESGDAMTDRFTGREYYLARLNTPEPRLRRWAWRIGKEILEWLLVIVVISFLWGVLLGLARAHQSRRNDVEPSQQLVRAAALVKIWARSY